MRRKFYLFLFLGIVATGLQAQSDVSRSPRRTNEKNGVKNSHGTIVSSTNETNKTLVSSELKGFPVINSTGDAEKDNQDYQLAKKQWIDQHPQEYKSFLDAIELNKEVVYSMPGFPQYVDTGDAKADMTKYRAAKSLWFKNNHDILAAMKNSKVNELSKRQKNIKK